MKKQKLFKIDGKYYNVFVSSLKREFSVLDGENSGRTLDGNMTRDIIGTYYNYSMGIDCSRIDPVEYADFYNLISAPDDSHNLVFPYNHETLSFKAYISNGEDELTIQDRDGNRNWNGLSVKFVAMKPQRRPA